MNHAELIERLLGVHHAALDWAEDFRRVGSIDGEASEKARAELLKSAATALDALVAERDALAAEVAKLSKPDWFYSADDPEYSYGDFEDAADDMGHDGITPLIGAREVWKKWAAVRCVALDANGDVDETEVMLFETEAEALRCWPESLAIARAALAQGGEK